MNETTTNVKALLLTQAHALRTQADVLEAQANALPDGDTGGAARDLLNVEQTLEQYNFGRDALLNANRRGELELVRGARNRIMVERCALEAYIRARPVVRPRKAVPAPDLDSWERDAERQLRALQGGRR